MKSTENERLIKSYQIWKRGLIIRLALLQQTERCIWDQNLDYLVFGQ